MSTNVNTHLKNPRVDVRKRNLDYTKQLTIVKSRDELKKYEANYHDDLKDDEVQQLTQLINKKKFEILVPDIGTIIPQTEANITSSVTDIKTKSNEESGSTAHSVNGDATSKTSTNVQAQQLAAAQAAALNKGIKPGQIACGADMSKGASQSMRDSALETQYLNYRPIFKMPAHYIKFKEPVYEGFENFSFNELNYEITEKDIKFLESGLINITRDDFERVIDVFEKIVVVDQNQSLMHLKNRFKQKAPLEIRNRISDEQLEIIYQKYWKSEREKRKRSFLRIFWEKADIDDQDQNAAFRKRQKEKMKLRKKTKYEIESYFKMFELRTDSVNVLRILQSVYQREEIKKKRHLVDWGITDITMDNTLKEKNIAYQSKAPKLDIKKLEQSQVDKVLFFHINEYKDYHHLFLRSSTQYLTDRPVTLQQRNQLLREQQAFQMPTPQKTPQQKLAALQQDQEAAGPTQNGSNQKQKSEAIKISTGPGASSRATRDQQKQAAQLAAEQALQEQKALETQNLMSTNTQASQNLTPGFQEGAPATTQGGATLGEKKGRLKPKKDKKLKEAQLAAQQVTGPDGTPVQPTTDQIGASAGGLPISTVPGMSRAGSTATGRGAAAQQKELPVQEDVYCSMEQITVITMLLAKKQQFGVTLSDKYLKMEINNAKDLKEKIEQTFEKPKIKSDEMDIDEIGGDATMTLRNESTMDQTHYSTYTTNKPFNQLQQQQQVPKKSTEQIELEEEFEALLNRNFVVRRGRNNRILVKMIERNIFEEEAADDQTAATDNHSSNSINLNSDSTNGSGQSKKSLLKKRRKQYYQTPLDFINREIPDHIRQQYTHLLQDRKFLFKKLKRTSTMYVQDNVKRLVTNQPLRRPSFLEESKVQSSDKQQINNFGASLMSLYGNNNNDQMMTGNQSFMYDNATLLNKTDSQAQQPLAVAAAQPPAEPINDSEQTINYILRMNLNELLELAEGVGEHGDVEAYAEGAHQLDEFQKQQEKNYRLFRMSRMPMIGGGGGGSHLVGQYSSSMGYSSQPQLSHQNSTQYGSNTTQQQQVIPTTIASSSTTQQQLLPPSTTALQQQSSTRIGLPIMQQSTSQIAAANSNNPQQIQQQPYQQQQQQPPMHISNMNGYINNNNSTSSALPQSQQQHNMYQQQQSSSNMPRYNGSTTNITLPNGNNIQNNNNTSSSSKQQQQQQQNDFQVVAAK